MSALKISDMSEKQSKRWINYVQKLKKLSDKEEVQVEIDKLKKREREDDDFSDEDEEKLECALFEMKKRKEEKREEKKRKEEKQEGEEKISLGHKVKLKSRSFRRKAPAAFFKALYYLFMGFAIYAVIVGLVKNIGMLLVALMIFFIGNLFNVIADIKTKRLRSKEAESISAVITKTIQESLPIDIGAAGAWGNKQQEEEAQRDTGEAGIRS